MQFPRLLYFASQRETLHYALAFKDEIFEEKISQHKLILSIIDLDFLLGKPLLQVNIYTVVLVDRYYMYIHSILLPHIFVLFGRSTKIAVAQLNPHECSNNSSPVPTRKLAISYISTTICVFSVVPCPNSKHVLHMGFNDHTHSSIAFFTLILMYAMQLEQV